MVHIFIDTNVYLHNHSFTTIDWAEIVGDAEYKIVVPLTVQTELDRKKTHHQKKVSEKAKSTLEKFSKVQKGEYIGRIEVLLQGTRPNKSIYEQYELDTNEADDKILASIIEYQALGRKILAANDISLRTRAKHFGIEVIEIPDKYASTETSDEEKEIATLKKQLEKLNSKSPKPKITFTDGQIKITYGLNPIAENISLEDYVTKENYLIKLQPYDLSDPLIPQLYGGYEPVRHYNRRLQDYRNELVIYFKDMYYFTLYKQRTYPLELVLENISGTLPLVKAEISLSFPEDIHFSTKKLKAPQHPQEPYVGEPLHTLVYTRDRQNYRDMGYEDIFKSARKGITFHVPELKHHKDEILPTVYFTFNEENHNFSIEYTLLADNLVDKVEGILHLIFV